MARVTVEDCTNVIPSRFELVALAAQRARVISAGGSITVERDNDKNAVVALREIANGTVDPGVLREQLVKNCQENAPIEHVDEEMDAASEEIVEEFTTMNEEAQASEGGNDLYGDDDVVAED